MLYIKNAKIYPGRGEALEKGQMLVENGKITAIGKDVKAPAGAKVLDLEGKVITPGFIDFHSHIGIWGDGEGSAGYDGNERPDAINPVVSALDAANPLQRSFETARSGGITTAQILPGSGNPIGGMGFVCKTYGTIIDDMVLKNPSAMKGAMGENPKRFHGEVLKHAPATRMAVAGLIREYFAEVREYMKAKEKAEAEGKPFTKKTYYENGAMVLKKEIPLSLHAHRHDDIVTAVRLCQELDVDFTIEHCTDGHKIADFLAKNNVFASVGPGLSTISKLETADFTDANPAIMHKAGVRLCLMTDHPFLNCMHFRAYGAISARYGISFEDTLKMMTITPAEQLKLDHRIGSLEVGKDADFLIFSGHPFSYRERLEATYIDGKCVWEFPEY